MSESVVRDIERAIEKDKSKLDAGKALERLHRNPDFKKLIVEGYMTAEAVRLVHAKADPACQTPDKQASVIRDIDSIGSFSGYLRTVEQLARTAASAIQANEQELEFIRTQGEE